MRVSSSQSVGLYVLVNCLRSSRDSPNHSVQTIDDRLIGHKSREPVKQVLFRELMCFLESRVTLFAADKQVDRQNFLVGEYRNRIIAVSIWQ